VKYLHLSDDLSTSPIRTNTKQVVATVGGGFRVGEPLCHHVICHRVKSGGKEKTRRKSMNIVEIVVLFVSQVCSVRFYWLKKRRVTTMMTYRFPGISEFIVCLWQNMHLTTEKITSHVSLVSVKKYKEPLLGERKGGLFLRLHIKINYFHISDLRSKTSNFSRVRTKSIFAIS
jgi:hypothetical protein